MKKNTILAFILTISVTFFIASNNAVTAFGNTFSMPENSNTDSDYNSYNINNQEKNNINRYSINNNDTTIIKNNSSNNNYTRDKTENSTENNTPKPTITTPRPIAKSTTRPTAKPTAKPTTRPKSETKPKDNSNNNKPTKITKIEFSKHFIKLPAGKTTDISFKTTPDTSSPDKLIYKSLDKSIVTFNNNKITGIKKGFTTILIMLPNGTVKAACSVKII